MSQKEIEDLHFVFISDWAWPSQEDIDFLDAHAAHKITVVVRESTSPCALNPFSSFAKHLCFSELNGYNVLCAKILPYQSYNKEMLLNDLGLEVFGEDVVVYTDFKSDTEGAKFFRNPEAALRTKLEAAKEFYEGDKLSSLHEYLTADQYLRYKAEYAALLKEITFKEQYAYKGCLNCCTADVLLVLRSQGEDYFLTVKRGGVIGNGRFALVGGHKEDDETFEQCANREFAEEIEIEEYIGTTLVEANMLADYPYRSQILCKPSMVYFKHVDIGDATLPSVAGKDDAADAQWMKYEDLNLDNMFEDHYAIVTKFAKEVLK